MIFCGMNLSDIDTWRKGHMAIAEWVDAWRLIPRALVAGYAYLTYKVVRWYMEMQPYMLEGCVPVKEATECLITAPSTQHGFLVTAVVGVAAAVFGLYTSSGRKWNGFQHWNGNNNESRSLKAPEDKGNGE